MTTDHLDGRPVEQREWWWEGLLSDAYSPPVVAFPINVLAAWLAGGGVAWWLAGLHFVLGALMPLLDIVWSLYTGRIADIHLPNRKDRIRPFVISVIGAAVTLLVFWRVEAPAILIAVAAGGLLQNVGLMAVTTVWQISVHGAAAAALATLVGLGLGTAPGVLAVVMLGLVGWARIRLDRHTPAQVVAGAFVGLAAVLISTHGILW